MTFNNITVYLGSGGKAPQIFKDAAINLGKHLADKNIRTVYGGMSAGTMGILADAALSNGGDVLGVIPTNIRDKDFVHQKLVETDRMIVTDSMWKRKKIMVDEGDAAVALPGGYGTVDEILEFLYWRVHGFHNKVIGLLNINDFWTPFLDFLRIAHENGHLENEAYSSVFVSNDIDDLLEKMSNAENCERRVQDETTKISAIEEGNLTDTKEPIIINDTDIENLYRLANALVMKQLNKITRNIGVLDDKGLFEKFRLWMYKAAAERFITPNCPSLAIFAHEEAYLHSILKTYQHINVDLHQKWSE